MYQLAFLLQQVNAYMAMAQNYCARKWTGQYQIRPMLAHVAFLVEPFARHMSPLEVLQCNHMYHSECFEGVLSSEQLELQELRRKVGRVELGGASNPLKNLTFTDPLVVKVSNLNLTCVFFSWNDINYVMSNSGLGIAWLWWIRSRWGEWIFHQLLVQPCLGLGQQWFHSSFAGFLEARRLRDRR